MAPIEYEFYVPHISPSVIPTGGLSDALSNGLRTVLLFSKCIWDTLIQKRFIHIMNVNIIHVDGTDISAKKEALDENRLGAELVLGSVAFLAEIAFRSPRKLFIFIIKTYIYRIEVSKNKLI